MLIHCLTNTGNEFGEAGVDEITTLVESLGCSDALQSMSDDEGDVDDEDDEEDDEDNSRVGDESNDADVSTCSSEQLDSSGAATSPDSSKASLSGSSSPHKAVSTLT